MLNCKYCNKDFETNRGCSIHERFCFLNPNKSVKAGHKAWNKGLTKETDIRLEKASQTLHHKYLSGELIPKHIKLSDETKRKLSESRKKYLAEHPDEHVWKRNDKFKSKPCEYLKQSLRTNNISFVEEYSPLIDYNYSLDIAFPDIKVAIEVNGNQHYNQDGTLRDYYQARHNIFEAAGWKIFELHYTKCYDLNNLEELFKLDIYDKDYVNNYLSRKEELKIKKEKQKQAKQQIKDKKILEIKTNLLNSNIDFTKFGWVGEAALIIGISPQKVSGWMQKNWSEFYLTCFHRKPCN